MIGIKSLRPTSAATMVVRRSLPLSVAAAVEPDHKADRADSPDRLPVHASRKAPLIQPATLRYRSAMRTMIGGSMVSDSGMNHTP
jgi:hypothetical protein